MASPQGSPGSPGSRRPSVYQSQPQLRVAVPQRNGSGDAVAGDKRAAAAGAAEHGSTVAPPPAGSAAVGEPHIASPVAKRQRLELQPVADSAQPAQQRQSSPHVEGGTPKGLMRAEYAGGSQPASPLAAGAYPASPYAHTPSSQAHAYTANSMPGGQWVWQPDASAYTGGHGGWVWASVPPPAPPPPPGPYGPHQPPAWPQHPGAWGPPTPGVPPSLVGYGYGPMHPYAGHYFPAGAPPPPGPPHGYSPGYYGPAAPPSQYPGFGSPPYPLHAGPSRPPVGAPAPQRPRTGGAPSGRYEAGPRDPAKAAAVAINRRITAAETAREIFDIVEREHPQFDTVCLATAMHKLANLRGAPNLHAQIVQAPEFFKLKQLILQRRAEFTARNLSNTLWSLAKANHHPGDEFLSALAGEVKAKAGEGNAQNVANMLWAFATLGHHPGDDVMEALAEAVKGKLWEFTAQNMSNTVLAFAKLEFQPGEAVLEGLAREALSKIQTFSPQALSNTLWGLSKLGIQADELMRGIGAQARSRLAEFNSQNLANSVWAYANIGLNPGDDLLQDFAKAAIQKMPEFSPQNISNFLWAFAKLELHNPDLFVQAGRHGARVMHTFTPQSISNMLWAYATLAECPDPTFLHALVAHAHRLLPDFSPQNLSNTAWALATLKECDAVRALHKGLLIAICGEVGHRLGDAEVAESFSRQHLANFVWALATLEHEPGKASLLAIADALVQRSDLCNPQEVSNSVWAFAKLGHYDGALMNSMAAEATRRIEEFSQQNLSNMAWAYAKLAHMDDELMAAIAGRAEGMVDELNLQHCTNLIWAYATLLGPNFRMLPTVLEEVKARMGAAQFNVQQVANLLWSMAISERCDRDVWRLSLRQLEALGVPYHELPAEALTQVFQAYMLVLADAPAGDWPIGEALLALAQNAWVNTTKKIKISEFHAEVSRMLSLLGVEHTIEHLTADHLFSVDISLVAERIAIEVDGPHHFTANTFQPLGEMASRRKLLRARGWRVVSVPFYHWSGEEEEGRRALLQRVVADARALPVPEVAPEHAEATARLQQLQASFLDRLPAWTAEDERRVAALRQQDEAEAGAAPVADAGAGTAGQQSGQQAAAPAPASSATGAAQVPAAATAAASPQTPFHVAAQVPAGAGVVHEQGKSQQQQIQQQAQPLLPPQQKEQPLQPDALPSAQPPAQPPKVAPTQVVSTELPAEQAEQAQQVQQAQQAAGTTASEQPLPAAKEAQQADGRAAPEQQLLAAKEAAMRLAESLSPRAAEAGAEAHAQPGLLLPPGFGPSAGTPAAAPDRTHKAAPPPQDVPTPLLPPGLGAVRTPGLLAGHPSPAALAAAEAAARTLSGARAPLFMSPPAPASKQQPLGRSCSAGSGGGGANQSCGASEEGAQ
ncbi:hypothetical protein ABPG75_011559 [Micractinium tetrahymenae]